MAYLEVKHVKYSEGGIPIFDLSSPDLKHLLKAPESCRKLPLHPTVLALEFLEERYEGRDPEEYLFSELPLIAIELIPGSGTKVMVPDANPISKWFGRFLDALGLEDPGLDLHATRGLISTILEERGVGDGLIDSITGHASSQRNVRKKNYSFEKDLAFKLEAIAKIDLPIDVPLLLAAWRRSPKRYDFRLPARTWRRKKKE